MPARMSTGVGCRHPVTICRGVVDTKVDKAGMSTATPRQERSTLRLNAPGLGGLFASLFLQHPNQSQQAASGA